MSGCLKYLMRKVELNVCLIVADSSCYNTNYTPVFIPFLQSGQLFDQALTSFCLYKCTLPLTQSGPPAVYCRPQYTAAWGSTMTIQYTAGGPDCT